MNIQESQYINPNKNAFKMRQKHFLNISLLDQIYLNLKQIPQIALWV